MLNLKLLKAIVFTLTFLLIFGIILLGMLVVKKSKKAPSEAHTVSLNEPEGSQIHQIVADGDRLYLWVQGGKAAERVIIYDGKNQQKISTITIN